MMMRGICNTNSQIRSKTASQIDVIIVILIYLLKEL